MRILYRLGLVLATTFALSAISTSLLADQAQENECHQPNAGAPGSEGHPLTEAYIAAQFPQGFAIHGVAGDRALLFAVQPADAPNRSRGVHLARRLDGALLGDVPPPAEGFGTPLTVKIQNFQGGMLQTSGTFLLMDNRVPPGLAGTQATRIYKYAYSYDLPHGFSAKLLETHVLPLNTVAPGAGLPNGLVYAGSIALLPQGRVAISDNATGAIWYSDSNLENWQMSVFDTRFMGQFLGPITGMGKDQSGNISSYTLLTPAPPGAPPGVGLYPGSHSITYAAVTDEICWAVTTPGGLYCIKRSDLVNSPIPPFAKTANAMQTSADLSPGAFGLVRQVVPVTHGLGDLTDGVDYDRFAPQSPWLYWQRAPADVGENTLRRVHLQTGVIQVVAANNDIFAWANEITALPPIFPNSPFTSILSSVGQEYNNPDVNSLLGGQSRYFAPSPMPISVVLNH